MKSRGNGFTLTELLISAGIMAILVSLAMSALITNFNSFKLIKNESELQFQSQYILNFISDKIMKSKNVALIKTGTSSMINSKMEGAVSRISLKYGDASNNCYIFEVRGGKIWYGNSYPNGPANDELGTYISELKAAPYPAGRTFAETGALKITLCLIKNGQEYETEQTVYMRSR